MRDLPKRMMDATQDVVRLVACLEEVRSMAAKQGQWAPLGTMPSPYGLIVAKIDETLGEK